MAFNVEVSTLTSAPTTEQCLQLSTNSDSAGPCRVISTDLFNRIYVSHLSHKMAGYWYIMYGGKVCSRQCA